MFLDAAGHNITLLHLLVSKVNLHKNVLNFFFVMIHFLVKNFFTRFDIPNITCIHKEREPCRQI
jgi:hypothetical protein